MRRGQAIYTLFGTILLLYLSVSVNFFSQCDARRSMHIFEGWTRPKESIIEEMRKLRVTKHFDLASLLLQRATMDSSNTQPYVSSPFTLPPYDSLGPIPFPQNSTPYCIYPPNTPQQPPSPFYYLPPVLPVPSLPPSPIGTVPSPPEFTPIPNPPIIIPSPPEYVPSPPIITPSPPEYVPSPPIYFPSPPSGPIYGPPSYQPPPPYIPSPPSYVFPPPTGLVPSPPTFLPPIVYPAPTVPPPPQLAPTTALWCVAKPAVPDPIIQEAMNYACASGADCDPIQPSGPCFEPNTLFAHASYAFNSFWQRTKLAGGTCSFGGTAILVTVDPSYDGCHFLNS